MVRCFNFQSINPNIWAMFGRWRVGREGKGNLRKWLFGIRAIWKKKIEVKSSKEKNKGSYKEVLLFNNFIIFSLSVFVDR